MSGLTQSPMGLGEQSMFQIESNVPVPVKRGKPSKYPFAQMAVGDSFFAAGVSRGRVGASAWTASKKYGHRYTTQAERDGTRVWRIA